MSAPFYTFSAKDSCGQNFDFKELEGKVVLIVNVASKCGFTGQYSGLQKLYAQYKDQGLVILGFPCNQFGGQEPGSSEEVVTFCKRTYDVEFPIMEKCQVNGSNTHPVYKFLKAQKTSWCMQRIKWNFEKFLIDRKGTVVARYGSMSSPAGIEAEVKRLCAQQ
eukprot:GDKI01010569.1.p1 GENE.GDKI01010569.1~~GDKI01010569.1.p1  ORF type:complete len:163 (-),score=50.57 GDKI01010569.1:876-1364(-)